MSAREQALSILMLIITVEEAIGDLYRVYAAGLPDKRDFWMRLQSDERLHAQWVRDLVVRVRKDELTIREGRFSPESFEALLAYIIQRTEEAKIRPPKPLEALTVAKDIESTIVERAFFEVLESDDPVLRQILRNLHLNTEAHAAQVVRRWREQVAFEKLA